MDLKSLLNKEQYEGAVSVEGQVLILAGAGSGKTRVLTYRMAHMIEDLGIPPYKILAITFTNKAAKEMKDRVKGIVGDKAESMWISTFHSTCVRILRREIEHLGYKSSFTIYDSSDQKTLVTECMKALNINDKDINYREIMGKIGRAKDKMQSPESYKREFESNFRENKIADVYLMYQKKLKENNAMDFDDLICKTVELFKKHPDVLGFYQRKFQYIMVDEYQDTNGAQYELVKLLADKYKNICVVGDDDQCLIEGTKIDTKDGVKSIEDIKENDYIKVAIGRGEIGYKQVSTISKKEINNKVVEISTNSGEKIVATPNHISFAKLNKLEGKFYVCLTYKNETGYKIEVVSSFEESDKLWMLKVCDNKEEVDRYIEYFSAKDIDTLFEEEFIYRAYPHYIKESKISLEFFGGDENKKDLYSHIVKINNQNIVIDNYDEAEEYSNRILSGLDSSEVIKSVRITENESLMFMPLGSIVEGMSVAIIKDEKVILDKVKSIEIKEYSGYVYDLNINEVRNYVANNILVHNCIYAWRGADISNILDFEKDYPNAKVIKLEQNYRSKANILNAANVVIANNSNRKDKALRTEQESGNKIKIYRAFDDRSEGDFVSKIIADIKYMEKRRYDDFAILYRTNAQSRIFEETLRRRGIAYKIVGGTRFYDRKEIKDLLSYLKALVNPQDDVSLKRIINVPKRSIGDATVLKVQEFANDFEINLWDALTSCRNIATLTPRNCGAIEKFTTLMENFMELKEQVSVSQLIETILKDTGYIEELKKSGEIEDKSRIENLEELVSDAVDFEKSSEDKSLEAYLEKVSLVQDTDKLEDEEDGEGSVVLMTIHSAKGLEFPVVFMVGMENGIFPSLGDMDKEDQMEESRRLCYVAITRAKEQLFMTSAEVRRQFGRTVSYSQSDFIGEIKSDLKEYINERGVSSASSSSMSSSNSYSNSNPHSLRGSMYNRTTSRSGITGASIGYSNTSSGNSDSGKKTISLDEATLGRKVKHPKFGNGTIVSVTPAGNDKKLTIAFDKQGVKVLLLSLANLELL